MTPEERAHKIEEYGKAYDELTAALAEFPREMWDYRSTSDPWTIQEIVVHITDSEANSFVRCRKFIAEPNPTLSSYDEPTWAKALDYANQSADDALELFRWLRGNTYKLIRNLPESTWANTAYHPENGTMTMDDWLDIYLSHPREHAEQAGRIYEEWKERNVIK